MACKEQGSKHQVQNNEEKTRRKRKLVYIPRRYLDLVTTKSWYLTSGIQLRVRDTINLLTWVNAESAYLVLGIRYWMVECWHLTNRIKIIKQCQHSGKWFNLYQKTSALISLIQENEPFSLIYFFCTTPHVWNFKEMNQKRQDLNSCIFYLRRSKFICWDWKI